MYVWYCAESEAACSSIAYEELGAVTDLLCTCHLGGLDFFAVSGACECTDWYVGFVCVCTDWYGACVCALMGTERVWGRA